MFSASLDEPGRLCRAALIICYIVSGKSQMTKDKIHRVQYDNLSHQESQRRPNSESSHCRSIIFKVD